MAHGESNPLIILAQLRDLEELKMQTPVTQSVISHIDMLVKLDEQKRKTLETFVHGRLQKFETTWAKIKGWSLKGVSIGVVLIILGCGHLLMDPGHA